MLSRLVTCSKKTPTELRAGDAVTRSSRPSRNAEIVADRPSPRPSMVSTAHDGESGCPGRRGGVRLVVIDEPERRVREPVASELPSQRRGAERPATAGPAPTRSSGTSTARVRAGQGTWRRLAPANGVVALLAARARAVPGSLPDRTSSRPRRGSAPGCSPACARQAAIDRAGNAISSLRRLRRSSLTANRSCPSCSSAAPESCPSQMPRMFTVGSTRSGLGSSEEQILDER